MLDDLRNFGIDLAIKNFHYLFCFLVQSEIEFGNIFELSEGKVVLRCDVFLLEGLLQILRPFDGRARLADLSNLVLTFLLEFLLVAFYYLLEELTNGLVSDQRFLCLSFFPGLQQSLQFFLLILQFFHGEPHFPLLYDLIAHLSYLFLQRYDLFLMAELGILLMQNVLLGSLKQLSMNGHEVAQLFFLELQHLLVVKQFFSGPFALSQDFAEMLYLVVQCGKFFSFLLQLLINVFQLLLKLSLHFCRQSSSFPKLLALSWSFLRVIQLHESG